MSKDKKKKPAEVTRRQFIAGTGIAVGGAAIGSAALLAACGGEGATETVTQTQTATQTVTTTQQVGTATVTATATETVSKFVCPDCSQEFASLTALQSHVATIHPPEVVEVPEKLTKLIVNGEAYELKVEPNWTLLKVLRENLGLTGSKQGCDIGECGACTVLMDNQPILSCLVLAVEADEKNILTIEGLSDGLNLHPIQESFVENDGLQCGFCTPGVIMSAKALFDNNPSPTRQDVREAIAMHLCRCTGYIPIVNAIVKASEKMMEGG